MGQVLFINAINEVERKNAQSYLEDRHIQRIATAYKNYCNDGDFARIATIQDIVDNNFSLSIPLYVKPEVSEDEIDNRTVQEHYDAWRAASEMMKLSYERLNAMLGKEVETMSKVKLGEVAIEHKETCKSSKDGYPIVGLEHLVPEEITLTVWDEGSDNTFTKMFRKGNVLFGRRRAYLKKAAVAPFGWHLLRRHHGY